MFKDRHDAGRQLAEKLAKYRGQDAVVLALPRGGVVVGCEIAQALELPLDIVVVRKVGHPNNPEYAIGAVDDKGTVMLNDAEAESVNQAWLADEIKRQKEEAMRRVKAYRNNREPVAISGKTALVVDDGIATGLTMRLVVRFLRAQNPTRIVVAVPVASAESVGNLRKEADEIITLEPPEEFLGAVGSHYLEFAQVRDAEVIRLLSE
ncbi:MAG: phosphoribosyltransferase family protein [bacterium]|nr:phosphoribosyltransferase family protein [bacterium]